MVNWLKQISAPAMTTSDIFAGDVLNWVIQYHNDVDLASGDPSGIVHILTETVFNNGKLKFYDSNKSHDITLIFPDYSEDKTVTFPTTWATSDEVVGRTSAMTLTNKTVDGNTNALMNIPKSALPSDTVYGNSAATQFALSKVSAPASPPTEEAVIYWKQIDANNNGLFVKGKKGGSIVEVQIV